MLSGVVLVLSRPSQGTQYLMRIALCVPRRGGVAQLRVQL